MKTLQIIVADKNQNGVDYINKNGEPFKMVHIELEDGTWASKYFGQNDFNSIPEWTSGDDVNIELNKNGQWTNWDFGPNNTDDESGCDDVESECECGGLNKSMSRFCEYCGEDLTI